LTLLVTRLEGVSDVCLFL